MKSKMQIRNESDWCQLRFDCVEDCIAEVHRIVAANDQGKLRSSGSWTSGQIMAHVASWIVYAYDGYPMGRPPFFVRWILRTRLPRMLANGMPRGIRIPGVKAGTYGMDEMQTSNAANRLVAALTRLEQTGDAKYDSPAFGPMSQADRIRLNLRHAELHLGYLLYY